MGSDGTLGNGFFQQSIPPTALRLFVFAPEHQNGESELPLASVKAGGLAYYFSILPLRGLVVIYHTNLVLQNFAYNESFEFGSVFVYGINT
jgi:hypothetical protein